MLPRRTPDIREYSACDTIEKERGRVKFPPETTRVLQRRPGWSALDDKVRTRKAPA